MTFQLIELPAAGASAKGLPSKGEFEAATLADAKRDVKAIRQETGNALICARYWHKAHACWCLLD